MGEIYNSKIMVMMDGVVLKNKDCIFHERDIKNQLYILLWKTVSQKDNIKIRNPRSYILFNLYLLSYLVHISNTSLEQTVFLIIYDKKYDDGDDGGSGILKNRVHNIAHVGWKLKCRPLLSLIIDE